MWWIRSRRPSAVPIMASKCGGGSKRSCLRGAEALRYGLACAAMAALLAVAFWAGRSYPTRPAKVQTARDTQAPERILLVAVGDYLERSQMVLIELANASANGPLDISPEQERAE